MRRKRDSLKISKTNGSLISELSESSPRPVNISSFMFLSMITLMMLTVASFLMYTFPYLLSEENVDIMPPKRNFNSNPNIGPRKTTKQSQYHHSVLKKGYTLDPTAVLEDRNVAMKKYSYPFDMKGVDKRSQLSIKEFRDVYDGKWPVIITDVVPTWPAFNWTKEFFTKHYGQSKVVMQAVDNDFKETLALPLSLYLSHLEDSREKSWTYLQDELFLLQRPELRGQVWDSVYTEENFFSLFPRETQPWDCMLLWGTANSRSTLHIDPYNWTGTNAVISGKKLWKLVPPGQDHLLSINHIGSCGFPMDCQKYNSPLDAHQPRNTVEEDLVSKVRFVEVEQNPGEILFIPTGWFHQAFNAVPTLAVSGQMMNSNNYKVVLEEIFKGGSIPRTSLPKHADKMSPKELVSHLASILPDKVLEQGAAVTKNALDQMKQNEMRMN